MLTPYGLRTLARSDPTYRRRYEGDVWSRDSAYHQGTVWPWLAGPFFSAKIRSAGDRSGLAKRRPGSTDSAATWKRPAWVRSPRYSMPTNLTIRAAASPRHGASRNYCGWRSSSVSDPRLPGRHQDTPQLAAAAD